MTSKLAYDMVVSTGSYKDGSGATKKKWLTIGKVFASDRGYFAILDRHINLAGLPPSDKGDGVMVSFFEPKAPGQTGSTPARAPSKDSGLGDFDDDIPF